MRWSALLAPLLFVAACSDFGIAPTGKDPGVPVDSDLAVPLDSDPPKKPGQHVKDTDPPPPADDTLVIESDPPIDSAPQGPVDPPVADAGGDKQVEPLKTVTLDGSGSYDPGGRTPLAYRWTTIKRPQGSTSIILNNRGVRPTFFVDVAGHYEIQLAVRNKAGVWDPTPDVMVIEAVPSKDLYIQLTWNAASDLDLHVVRDGMDVFDRGDCAFCNKNPSWYASGRADDPSLDWDVINGYGPETTTVITPAAQNYHVKVHYYGVGGATDCGGSCPTSTATIKFYRQATLLDTMTRVMHRDDEVWNVAVYDGVSGTIQHVDTMGTSGRTTCQ